MFVRSKMNVPVKYFKGANCILLKPNTVSYVDEMKVSAKELKDCYGSRIDIISAQVLEDIVKGSPDVMKDVAETKELLEKQESAQEVVKAVSNKPVRNDINDDFINDLLDQIEEETKVQEDQAAKKAEEEAKAKAEEEAAKKAKLEAEAKAKAEEAARIKAEAARLKAEEAKAEEVKKMTPPAPVKKSSTKARASRRNAKKKSES